MCCEQAPCSCREAAATQRSAWPGSSDLAPNATAGLRIRPSIVWTCGRPCSRGCKALRASPSCNPAIEKGMMTRLWTWTGIDFGYRDGDELWSHDGRHVGRFYGDQVYAPDGSY